MHGCLSNEQLLMLLRGAIPDDDIGALEDHVETCAACQRRLENLGDPMPLSRRTADAANANQWAPFAARLVEVLMLAGDSVNRAVTAYSARPVGSRANSAGVLPEIQGYEILGMLGQGGMGAVYDAVQLAFGRPVAIKILPESSTSNPELLARFVREMAAIGQLDHPNIVQAIDAAECNGVHYLVMEKVDGRTVSDITKESRRLKIEDACDVIRQTAEGIRYAHRNGLVHRDIKPSNIMVGKDGVVQLLDLGLSRLSTDNAPTQDEITSTGQIIGTVDYMSPEQAAGRPVTTSTDIYSLGATLYRMLTGVVPFHGDEHHNILRKLYVVAHELPPPIRSIQPSVPADLQAIIERMMDKLPDHRFTSVAEVIEALAPYCRGANMRALCDPITSTGEIEPNEANDTKRLKASVSTVSVASLDAVTATSQRRAEPLSPMVGLIGMLILVVGVAAMSIFGTSGAAIDSDAIASETVESRAELAGRMDAPSAEPVTIASKLASDDWTWTDPINLGPPVNTKAGERSPELSADGLRLLFVRNGDLYTATRPSVDAPFGNVFDLGPHVNSKHGENAGTLSIDGLTLYFASRRAGYSIFVSHRESVDAPFGEPELLWPDVNIDVGAPRLSRDNLSLYVTVMRDLFVARRSSHDEPFPHPVHLGKDVNSKAWDAMPAETSDGSAIILRSNREGHDPGDLWLSVRQPDGSFGVPSNLGDTINSPSLEAGSSLSSDGETLYFHSRRGSPLGSDIWMSRRVRKSDLKMLRQSH